MLVTPGRNIYIKSGTKHHIFVLLATFLDPKNAVENMYNLVQNDQNVANYVTGPKVDTSQRK